MAALSNLASIRTSCIPLSGFLGSLQLAQKISIDRQNIAPLIDHFVSDKTLNRGLRFLDWQKYNLFLKEWDKFDGFWDYWVSLSMREVFGERFWRTAPLLVAHFKKINYENCLYCILHELLEGFCGPWANGYFSSCE